MENPWKDNERNVSCIPEGTYAMRKRISPIVQRTSRGEFEEGWEVCDVEGIVDEARDDIIITIKTFERVWNPATGLHENGEPIDINELQSRHISLRLNEVKQEEIKENELSQ